MDKITFVAKKIFVIFLLSTICCNASVFAQPESRHQSAIYIEDNILRINATAVVQPEKKFYTNMMTGVTIEVPHLCTAEHREAIEILRTNIEKSLKEHPEWMSKKGIRGWINPAEYPSAVTGSDARIIEIKHTPCLMTQQEIEDWLVDGSLLKEKVKGFFSKDRNVMQKASHIKCSLINGESDQKIKWEVVRFLEQQPPEYMFSPAIRDWLKPEIANIIKIYNFLSSQADQWDGSYIGDWVDQDLLLQLKIAGFLKTNPSARILGVNIKNCPLQAESMVAILKNILSRDSEYGDELNTMILTIDITDSGAADLANKLANKVGVFFDNEKFWQVSSRILDNTFIVRCNRAVYFDGDTLIIDGKDVAEPRLDEDLVEKIVNFLKGCKKKTIRGVQIKNWQLSGLATMNLLEALTPTYTASATSSTTAATANAVQLSRFSFIGNGVVRDSTEPSGDDVQKTTGSNMNSVKFISEKIASFIENSYGLIDIEYHDNTIDEENFIGLLSAFSQSSNLRRLDLSRNIITENVAKAIGIVLEKCKNLETIVLQKATFDEAAVLCLLRSCLQHARGNFDFSGVAIEEYIKGYGDLVNLNLALHNLLFALVKRNNKVSEEFGLQNVTAEKRAEVQEKIFPVLLHGSEEEILAILGSTRRVKLDQNELDFIKSLREYYGNLVKLLKFDNQKTSLPALSVYPDPSDERKKELEESDGFVWVDKPKEKSNISGVKAVVSTGNTNANVASKDTRGWFRWAGEGLGILAPLSPQHPEYVSAAISSSTPSITAGGQIVEQEKIVNISKEDSKSNSTPIFNVSAATSSSTASRAAEGKIVEQEKVANISREDDRSNLTAIFTVLSEGGLGAEINDQASPPPAPPATPTERTLVEPADQIKTKEYSLFSWLTWSKS